MYKKHFLLLALLSFFFFSCEEIAPTVTGSMPGDGGGPNVGDQQRQVLIEEFTGVRCVNCPAGSAAIQDLLSIYGDQLVAVSIHAGEFSPPYADSKYDLRTPEGDQIINYLGAPFGFPTAVVNRKQFDGNFGLQLSQSKWAGHIAEESALPPKVKIALTPEYNPATRKLDAEITLFVQEDITEDDVRISLMITESGIHDLQLTPSGKDPDYTHNHVLRGMMTNFEGEIISEPLTTGAEITRHFSYTFPDEWVPENCELVGFVSLGGDKKDVLQAHKVHVVE